MQIQPRDLRILELIGELGIATVPMIHSRFWERTTEVRACQQRLKLLETANLIAKKPQAIIDGGRLPDFCFLLPAGAELVESHTGIYPKRVTHPKTDSKPFTIRHRLATVEARLVFDKAAQQQGLPAIDWIMEQDTDPTIPHSRSSSPSERFLLRSQFKATDGTVTFFPDSACHLQIPRSGSSSFDSLLLYFEVDRSTEAHNRWAKKLRGIEAFLADATAWQKHWPSVTKPAVALFILCPSQQRIKGLTEVVRDSKAAQRIRFTTFPLNPEALFTEKVWQNSAGENYAILK